MQVLVFVGAGGPGCVVWGVAAGGNSGRMQSDPELKTQIFSWWSKTVPGAHSNFILLVAYLLPPTHLCDGRNLLSLFSDKLACRIRLIAICIEMHWYISCHFSKNKLQ